MLSSTATVNKGRDTKNIRVYIDRVKGLMFIYNQNIQPPVSYQNKICNNVENHLCFLILTATSFLERSHVHHA